ncbi:Zinc-finger homeodomain protein 1 [Rhynchospora pubera]|uniref:Zinc-finger homeodomain protein 1 n=1 Tax=Rhynchospora pubera TaxID=906938 RepID=A0AAV8CMH9_9POAL|nr:Zinc-finger homeodomain protein 1 [Rhynchospora pubera]KAJ4761686.1 Zinc-finger homeodomain protein 1 [Rhynchospora pubera]KAJ4814169.1 Zinc-finger homeodomain protein 1 [Rhynchospora pubera]
MDLSVVPYGCSSQRGGSGARYGECMRNHAAAKGGQAFDGCGEFMAGGAAGSPESLMCAACGCHRSFHRRDGVTTPRRPILQPIAYLPPPPPLPLTYHPMPPQMAPPVQLDRSRSGSETPPRADEVMASAAGRKRYRTKFTPEQKERMKEFAERLGWRIQRHDDGALERFCLEIGVDRHVLKVWMHNHKNQMASPGSGGGGGTGGMGVETVSMTGGAAAGGPVEAAAIRV